MSEAVKPLGEADRATTASDDGAHAGLVEIDAADDGFADLRSGWELFEHVIGDEALIDEAQGAGKISHATLSVARRPRATCPVRGRS